MCSTTWRNGGTSRRGSKGPGWRRRLTDVAAMPGSMSQGQRGRCCMAISTEAAPTSSDRYQRQSAILPRERLQDCPVAIIGVGAIGRQVALQLAVMGVGPLTLIDHDTVEAVNLGAQGYLDDDLGRPKVEA